MNLLFITVAETDTSFQKRPRACLLLGQEWEHKHEWAGHITLLKLASGNF